MPTSKQKSILGPFQGDVVVAAAFEGLSATDRRIVETISILHSPSTFTTVCKTLRRLHVRDASGRAFTTSTLRPVLERLEHKGLLVPDVQPVCPTQLVDAITRSAQQTGNFERIAVMVENLRKSSSGRFEDAVSLMRIQVFRGDTDALWQTWSKVAEEWFPWVDESPIVPIFMHAFDPDWFRTLPAEMQKLLLPSLADYAVAHLVPMPGLVALLTESAVATKDKEDSSVCQMLAELLLLRGELAALDKLVDGWYSPSGYAIRGASKVLQGDISAAIELYENGITALRKIRRKRKVFFRGHTGLLYIAALLETGDESRYKQAFSLLDIASDDKRHPMPGAYLIVQEAVSPLVQDLESELADDFLHVYDRTMSSDAFGSRWSFIRILWLGIGRAWHGLKRQNLMLHANLKAVEKRALEGGFVWVAATAREMMATCGSPAQRAEGKKQPAGGKHHEFRSLGKRVKRAPRWQRTLDALSEAVAPPNERRESGIGLEERKSRLAWRIAFHSDWSELQAVEQRRNAKGTWSKGRPVALTRLYETAKTLDWLTPQDKAVCAHILREPRYEGYSARYTQYDYSLGGVAACRALRGHPLIFLADSPTERLEIIEGEPEIKVSTKGKGYQIEIVPGGTGEAGEGAVVRDGRNRLKVVTFNPIQQRLRRTLGKKDGMSIPAAGKATLSSVLSAISPHIRIQSDLLALTDHARAVQANSKPTLRLYSVERGMTQHGLRVELVVHPFANPNEQQPNEQQPDKQQPGKQQPGKQQPDARNAGIQGPSYHCGVGGVNVVADVDGARLSTVRDLGAETDMRASLWARVPALGALSAVSGSADTDVWVTASRDAGLDLVRQLDSAGDVVFIEWPDGDRWRVHESLSMQSTKLRIRTRRDDFLLTGEAQLDDGEAVTISSLFTLLADSPGPYLQLEDGSFVALSDAFRERLDDLRAYGQTTDKGLELPRVAALTLADIFDGAGRMRVDKKWREHLARLQEDPGEAEVPSTLQAELRDYQLDGYRWLCKLAHWGVGACLADDMGLGKTIQALALLLNRATDGPTLVVAPTSVVPNWIDEANRFAPTLQVVAYYGKNRRALLDDLGPFRVLICSYAILQRDAKQLKDISWNTLIFDEAQAIKNRTTRRWKAARSIKATYRVMMTGTPIENRVTELWNLFAILDPGLLGSPTAFAKRYANPIEKHDDRKARARLSRLIRPFVLRRTKTRVLRELPPRTDLVLHVDLSADEAALYEAIRKQALERIEGVGDTDNARQIQIFAELMRLRRACCSPALVLPDAPAASAKLGVFMTLVDDLVESGHRALVFSQFVDHLSLIRKDLDAAGRGYHYLDGATSMKQRKQRIDAFQAGEHELFLISLKAGGLGLNLTGADYVIHMDPWWNPATEDQASDRAHRIGQTRPVTVYRLVARGTIEERILALHRQKRSLADGLLRGTEESATLNAKMLLQLIKDVN